MGKNNNPVRIVQSASFTNRHTGAKVIAAPVRMDGEPAFIVKDRNLNAYALDNFERGQARGIGLGFGCGVGISAIIASLIIGSK